jgi:NAD(P)-dependent dehydrogenase (short-subunit alcohol dehydrogenase family)
VQRQGEGGMAGAEELVRTRMPSGRFLQGSEIAEAAVWLCSDGASGLTGAIIAVDGGMSAV